MHFVVDVLALRVEALQDLRQNVDRLLAAQTGALGLELLQQVFGGHRFTDEVAPHCFLRQLHVAAEEKNNKTQRASPANFSPIFFCLPYLPCYNVRMKKKKTASSAQVSIECF